MKKTTKNGNAVMTCAQLTDAVLEIQASQKETASKVDQILAMMLAKSPEPPKAEIPEETIVPKKAQDNGFVDHLKVLHNRTEEEKEAAKRAWHEFHDAEWSKWQKERDAKYPNIKKAERSILNSQKEAELKALWRAMKK